jgi:hypothetical protein
MDAHREHMLRIRRIVARWEAGEINLQQKRAEIDAENLRYYQGQVPRRVQGKLPTYDAADALADAHGVPRECALAALDAQHCYYRAAANLEDEDPEAAEAVRRRGAEVAREILMGPAATRNRDATAWPPAPAGASGASAA